MRTRIIAAFPGVGKTEFYKQESHRTIDSDSSLFSWIIQDGKKIRNPEFPNNYIQHIKENIGKYEYILVSSHKEVRDALKDNCLFFYLIYPVFDAKNTFLERYKQRGSPDAFINLVDSQWESWMAELTMSTNGCRNIQMCCDYLIGEIYTIEMLERGRT